MPIRQVIAAGRLVAILTLISIATPMLAAPQFRTESYRTGVQTSMALRRPGMIGDDCVSGQCVIRLAPGVTQQQFEQLLARQQSQVLEALPYYRMYVVSLPGGTTVAAGVTRWLAQPGIADAGPNAMYYLTRQPNDPRYSEQYHWLRVSAPLGWDMTTGSPTVVVAVVDSGLDLDHEDITGRLWVNADEIPGDGIDNDGNGFIDDINGWDFLNNDNDPAPHPTDPIGEFGGNHGTHCAGIIGAATDNGVGIAGHDWNCKLMTCKVFPDDGEMAPMTTIIQGVNYAVANGAKVVSLSLGGMYTSLWDAPLQQARAAGVVIVAAAGNEYHEFTDDRSSWESPVCNDGPNPAVDNWVLGVAATDANDVKADFSNYDGSSTKSFVDVTAPGVDILSLYIQDPANGFTQPYGKMSGTSMACPCVAGLASLLAAQFPALTPLDLIEQIKAGCDNIDVVNPMYAGKLGAGRINTPQAIGLDLPPGPPRSVMAGDTPNDEGSSITVSWSKSLDDGRGRNDVREYVVYRCDNQKDDTGADQPLGNWTQKVRVPVGEPLVFVDVTVQDKVPYWYKVSARDAKNETESAPVGPAIARDDLPPPAVENVKAVDNQADDGGAISLSWSDYTASPDFMGYRVYRSETPFTRISQATRIDEIEGDPARCFYLDSGTTDGVDYWYAVTAYDDEDNELQQVTPVGPVQSAPNFTVSLPAGTLMVALGANTREKDMAKLLGFDPTELKLARWDPYQLSYRTYLANPNDSYLQQAPGRAFWLRVDEPLLLNLSGDPVTQDPFTVALVPGWNMVGNPFAGDLRWEGLKVSAGGTLYGLPESNKAGITLDFAWIWDPASNAYQLVSEYANFGGKSVRQNSGFWFKAMEPCDLLLPSGTTAARVASAPKSIDVDWQLRLVARSGNTADCENYIGVSTAAATLNKLVSPPRPEPGVELYFVNTGVDGPAAASFVGPAEKQRWEARVQVAGVAGEEVQITWPDLSGLPAGVRPVLVDQATGKRLYLRTNSVYRFRPAPGETERTFVIEIVSGSDALRVTSLSARPGGAGVNVVFTLSAPASVDVEVLNIAGRRVRTLATSREAAAGSCSAYWNGAGDGGTPVPAGMYLVRVKARAADGQETSSVTTVSLRR